MTKPMMDLRELVGRSGDADLLREMIGFAAERLMELEVGGQTGAAYGEKSPERRAPGATQRLPRPRLADPRRERGALHSEAADGQLLPILPRAATGGGEGADGGHPGSLCPRRLDARDGRSREGHGRDRHLQEPGQPVVRGD
ncbi:transposase [Roseivivax marinus]|jgi:hypothetical protein|uniref:Transposase n=1 Tax=Roseivivax marinus TaxID=1379903 RepID=W4HFP9_9RHOB|nr:transposase [Roseivivax marinus]